MTVSRPVVLTGDRTTEPLHLGHFAGSLKAGVELQHHAEQYLLLADLQALTDNAGGHHKVATNVIEVALDYLAVGIDPALSAIVVQSQVPELAELTMLLMNLVTVSRLECNPTIKEEIRLRGFERDIPARFPGLSGQPGGRRHGFPGDRRSGRQRPVAADRAGQRTGA